MTTEPRRGAIHPIDPIPDGPHGRPEERRRRRTSGPSISSDLNGATGEPVVTRPRAIGRFESEVIRRLEDFHDPRQEWRRLFSEGLGTFFLVLVAAGAGMMGEAFPNTISRTAAVTAPGLMVTAVILFMGRVSGAHLNPAVSVAFALRGDFPWRRVPGHVVVQLLGATVAALFLSLVINVSATYGSTYPAVGSSPWAAFWIELVLTLRPRERDPRDRVGGAERRHHRRVRGRQLHRARRVVGESDLGSLDEPGAHLWA